jgi:hypothetical protein
MAEEKHLGNFEKHVCESMANHSKHICELAKKVAVGEIHTL